MTPSALQDTGLANDIVTFGAGVVALVFFFAILYMIIREGIPAFKTGVAAIIQVVDKMSNSLDNLNQTMAKTQSANTAALEALKQQVNALEIKLDYHIDTAERIDNKVATLHTNTSEIRERVRNCGISRDPSMRTREGD